MPRPNLSRLVALAGLTGWLIGSFIVVKVGHTQAVGQSYTVNCATSGTLISAQNGKRYKISFYNLDTAGGITITKESGSFTRGEAKLLSGQGGSDLPPAYTGAWRCYGAALGSLLVGETSKP